MTLEELKKKALFACIWEERPQGGFNSYDWQPFVAVKKITDRKVPAYEGYLLDPITLKDKSKYIKVGNFCYNPITYFNQDGDNRITVSDSVDEIIKLFVNRLEKP